MNREQRRALKYNKGKTVFKTSSPKRDGYSKGDVVQAKTGRLMFIADKDMPKD